MSSSTNGITPAQEQAQLTEWADFTADFEREHDGETINEVEAAVERVIGANETD